MFIWGSYGVLDDFGGKLFIEGVVLKVDGFLEVVFSSGFEWGFSGFVGSDFYFLDFVLFLNYNMFVVWCLVIIGIYFKNSLGFLLIFV